jgi:hypothetical protein
MKNFYAQKKHYREMISLDAFLFQPIFNKFFINKL